MDLISDHFISYDEDFTVKQEKLSDPEVSFTSPFSLASDSTSFYPTFINPVLRNMLENPDLTIKQSIHTEDVKTLKLSKPFKISTNFGYLLDLSLFSQAKERTLH